MCSKDADDIKIQDVEPGVASEEVEDLSEEVFTKPLVLAQGFYITSLN